MDNRLLKLRLKDTLSALADLLMPRVCLACGRTLTLRERYLCLPCSMDLPLTRFELWEHNPMADRYNAAIGKAEDHPEEAEGATVYEPYQRAAALIYYRAESGYSEIPQSLKYRRNFAAGRHFAAMLGRRLAGTPLFGDVDMVVPVPLHWTRRLRRGYNQAEVIAREVARALGAARGYGRAGGIKDRAGGIKDRGGGATVTFAPRLLRRARRTKTQTRLSGEDKHRNVAGAFEVRGGVRGCWRDCWRGGVRGGVPFRHILLIDDVFTTGSTLAACHAALRKVFGPEVRISVATLAFTG